METLVGFLILTIIIMIAVISNKSALLLQERQRKNSDVVNRLAQFQHKLERAIRWSKKAIDYAESRDCSYKDKPISSIIIENMKVGSVKWGNNFYYRYYYSKKLIEIADDMIVSISNYGLFFKKRDEYIGSNFENLVDIEIKIRIESLVSELDDSLHSLESNYGV